MKASSKEILRRAREKYRELDRAADKLERRAEKLIRRADRVRSEALRRVARSEKMRVADLAELIEWW